MRPEPLDLFTDNKNVCRPAEQRIMEALSRMRRQRVVVETEDATDRWLFPSLRLLKEGGDPGKQVWGSGVVPLLRGEAVLSKMAIAAFYPALAWLLGWRSVENCVTVLGMFLTLHVLLPYVHRQYYVAALDRCRQEASKSDRAVDPAFAILSPSEHVCYMSFAHLNCRSSRPVALFLYTACFYLRATWAFFSARGAAPTTGAAMLLLTGSAFFLLHEYARERGRHRLRHWLECTVLLLGYCALALPLLYGWLSGDRKCGIPAAALDAHEAGRLQLLTYAGLIYLIDTAVRAAASEWPLPMSVGMALVLPALTLMLMPAIYFCCYGCIAHHSITMLAFQAAIARMPMLAAFVAFRITREEDEMLRYLSETDPKAGERGPAPLLMAFKLTGISPAGLQPDLRERVAAAMQVEPEAVTGVIRPGCVLLGLTVRPSGAGRARGAWSAALSHDAWGDALLRQRDSTYISMSCQGTTYLVRDGRLDYTALETDVPSIVCVHPLVATSDCGAVRFGIDGFDGHSFKVLMRTAKDYLDLDVISERSKQPGAPTAVTARLPRAAPPGLAWLEVMIDTGDGRLLLSEASPMMFTPLPEAAEELNRFLLACDPAAHQDFVDIMEELSDCLHHGVEASPGLLLTVARLGLVMCFSRLPASRSLLRAADKMGQGLLGAAAQSNSEAMVLWMIMAMRKHRLPVDPLQRSLDARGYTPLHWAANGGNCESIYLLLAETLSPQESWGRLLSRRHGVTPAQIVEAAGGLFVLDAKILARATAAQHDDKVGEEARGDADEDEHSCGSSPAAWHGEAEPVGYPSQMLFEGHAGVKVVGALRGPTCHGMAKTSECVAVGSHLGVLMATLKGRTPTARVCLLVAYTSVLLLLGWREPLSWWTLAVTAGTLHCVLPYILELYAKGLDEARALAADCGLHVSSGFSCRVDPPHAQAAYERFLSRRATHGIGIRTAVLLAVTLLFSAPARTLVAARFSANLRFLPMALSCALLAGRTWAIHSGRTSLWQMLDICLDWYIPLVHSLPAIHIVVMGWSAVPNFPSKAMLQVAQNDFLLCTLVALALTLYRALLCFAQKRPSMSAASVRAEVCHLILIALVFTPVASRTAVSRAGDWRRYLALGSLRVAHRVAMFGHRLRTEHRDLRAFLRLQLSHKED